jgi:hypothetical protein
VTSRGRKASSGRRQRGRSGGARAGEDGGGVLCRVVDGRARGCDYGDGRALLIFQTCQASFIILSLNETFCQGVIRYLGEGKWNDGMAGGGETYGREIRCGVHRGNGCCAF